MASSRSFGESFCRPRIAEPRPTRGRKSVVACAIMRKTLSFTGSRSSSSRTCSGAVAGSTYGSRAMRPPSGHVEAAVHVERDAVDVGRLVRGEKGDRGGLLLGRRDALDGHEVPVGGEPGAPLLGVLVGASGAQERGVDTARTDGVHAHAAWAVVEGEVARESEDTRLAGGVRGPAVGALRASRQRGDAHH